MSFGVICEYSVLKY